MHDKLQEIGSILYLRLPIRIRKSLLPVGETIYQILKRFLQIASGIRQPVHLLRGKNKWGEGELTLLFYGDDRELAYITDLIYSIHFIKVRLGKFFIWNINSLFKSDITEHNMIICAVDKLFLRLLTKQKFIVMPQWVQFLLDLSKPTKEIWYLSKNQKKSLRNDFRKIAKYKYSYEISHDPADFRLFYYEMYIPYTLTRYQNTPILSGYNSMKLFFDKGFLLFLKQGNDYLGGILIYFDKQTLTAHSVGVKEGNFMYVQQGVLSALHHFTIHWAKEQGYRWIDFYFARPFLKNGVYSYKRKLGMEIKPSKKNRAFFGLKIGRLNRGVRDFFANNSFIYMDHGKLKGLAFIGHNRPIAPRDIKTFAISGLDTLVIISSRAISNQANRFVGSLSKDAPSLVNVDPEVFFEDISNILSI